MENNSNEMKASLLNWNDSEALQQAIKIIFKGGIIVYPTDTIYGFGVDATNENSINQLNKLKNRTGPISVIAPDKMSYLHGLIYQTMKKKRHSKI